MIDFVPLDQYTTLYYYTLLFVVVITLIHTYALPIIDTKVVNYNQNLGIPTLIFILFYMGLRPVSHVYFGDMLTYNNLFLDYAKGVPITSTEDVLFHTFTKLLSSIVNVPTYFLICAGLYVVPLYFACKKWFQVYWFYGFLFLITSFSFWAYGTNGIRNGIAGSLFILGISRDKRVWQVLWIFIAINFHNTMLLPAIGFVLANLYNRPKLMIVFWLLTIPASLIGGGVFETVFGVIGLEDERISYYFTTEADSDIFKSIGFRWDFLAYSSTAVFAGWYYIVMLNYKDKIYFWLFNTYVFTNAFWILVIRANFSNRFAYLSWFMIGLVIIYPLLKKQIIPKQHQRIGLILLAYFGFTFLMGVIL